MSNPATLALDNVSVKRGEKILISDLSLSLSGPKLLWVVGGNGIGKTSFLRTCAGLSRPETGTISWSRAGAPISAPEAVSFLPSDSYAKPRLKTKEDAKFWDANLGAANIEPHGDTLTEQLSTGQTKRLSFAKLLADAGVDEAGRHLIARHLQTHVRAGGLALVASHAPITVQDIATQKLILE